MVIHHLEDIGRRRPDLTYRFGPIDPYPSRITNAADSLGRYERAWDTDPSLPAVFGMPRDAVTTFVRLIIVGHSQSALRGEATHGGWAPCVGTP
jgi:hypothetical protein